MYRIRKLIYRLGFNPQYPSIFFSPSERMIRVGGPAARKGFIEGIERANQKMMNDQNEIVKKVSDLGHRTRRLEENGQTEKRKEAIEEYFEILRQTGYDLSLRRAVDDAFWNSYLDPGYDDPEEV